MKRIYFNSHEELRKFENKMTKLLDGKYEFYLDGVLLERSNFRKGKLHGPRITFEHDGRVREKRYFENGRSNGPCKLYNWDSNYREVGWFIWGSMTGLWEYHANGRLIKLLRFNDDLVIEELYTAPFKDPQLGNIFLY